MRQTLKKSISILTVAALLLTCLTAVSVSVAAEDLYDVAMEYDVGNWFRVLDTSKLETDVTYMVSEEHPDYGNNTEGSFKAARDDGNPQAKWSINFGANNYVTLKNIDLHEGLSNIAVALGTEQNPGYQDYEAFNARLKVELIASGVSTYIGDIYITHNDNGVADDGVLEGAFGVSGLKYTFPGYTSSTDNSYVYAATKEFKVENQAALESIKGLCDIKLTYTYDQPSDTTKNLGAFHMGAVKVTTKQPATKTKVYSIANDYNPDDSAEADMKAIGVKNNAAGDSIYIDGYINHPFTATNGQTAHRHTENAAGFWIKNVDFSSKLTNIRVAVGANPTVSNYTSRNARFEFYVNVDGVDYNIGCVKVNNGSWGDYIKDGAYSYQGTGNLLQTALLSKLKGKYDVKVIYTYDHAGEAGYDVVSGLNFAAVEFSTYGDYTGESVSPDAGTPAVYSIKDNYSTDGTAAMNGTASVRTDSRTPYISLGNGAVVTVKNVSFANGLQNVYAAVGTAPDTNQVPELGNANIKVYVTDANEGKDYLVGRVYLKSTDEGDVQNLSAILPQWAEYNIRLNTWSGNFYNGKYYYAATKNFEPTALAAKLKGTYDVKLVYEYTGAGNGVNFAAVRFVSDGTYEGATVNPSELTDAYTINNDYNVYGTGKIVTEKLIADGAATNFVSTDGANFRISFEPTGFNVIPNQHGSSFVIKNVDFANGLKDIKMSVGTTNAKTDFAGKVRYQVAVRYNGIDYPIGSVNLKNATGDWNGYYDAVAEDYSYNATVDFTSLELLSILKGKYDVVFTCTVDGGDFDYQMTVAAVKFAVDGEYTGETVEPSRKTATYTVEQNYGAEMTGDLEKYDEGKGNILNGMVIGKSVTIKDVNFENGLVDAKIAAGTHPYHVDEYEPNNARFEYYVLHEGKEYLVGMTMLTGAPEGWGGYADNDKNPLFGATKSFTLTDLGKKLKGTYDVKVVYAYDGGNLESLNFYGVQFVTTGDYSGEPVDPSEYVYTVAQDYGNAMTGSLVATADGILEGMKKGDFVTIDNFDIGKGLEKVLVSAGTDPAAANQYTASNARFEYYVVYEGKDYLVGKTMLKETNGWDGYATADGKLLYDATKSFELTEIGAKLKGKYTVKAVYTHDSSSELAVNFAAIKIVNGGSHSGVIVDPSLIGSLYTVEDNYGKEMFTYDSGDMRNTETDTVVDDDGQLISLGKYFPNANRTSLLIKDVDFGNGLKSVSVALGTSTNVGWDGRYAEAGANYRVYVLYEGRKYTIGQIMVQMVDQGIAWPAGKPSEEWANYNGWQSFYIGGDYYFGATKEFVADQRLAALKGKYDVIIEYTQIDVEKAGSVNFGAIKFEFADGTYTGAPVKPAEDPRSDGTTYTVEENYADDQSKDIVTLDIGAVGESDYIASEYGYNLVNRGRYIATADETALLFKNVNFGNGLKNIHLALGTSTSDTEGQYEKAGTKYKVYVVYEDEDYHIGDILIKMVDKGADWGGNRPVGWGDYNGWQSYYIDGEYYYDGAVKEFVPNTEVLAPLKGIYDVKLVLSIADDYDMTAPSAINFGAARFESKPGYTGVTVAPVKQEEPEDSTDDNTSDSQDDGDDNDDNGDNGDGVPNEDVDNTGSDGAVNEEVVDNNDPTVAPDDSDSDSDVATDDENNATDSEQENNDGSDANTGVTDTNNADSSGGTSNVVTIIIISLVSIFALALLVIFGSIIIKKLASRRA